MTISEWLKGAKEALEQSGCPDPAVDSRWIAEDVLHMSPSALRFEANNVPGAQQLAEMNECLRRRMQGEPVQYILKRADFMGLQLYVDSRVLIPRQDTETLVEAAIVELQSMREPSVLDMCAGSGAIGLSIKTLVPRAEVTLTDVSQGALEVVRKNAHDLGAEVSIRQGDLFKAVGREKFDLIVSNPPYIPRADMAELQREVTFEPGIALDGGLDGLDFYRRIAADAGKHLKPGGCIYLEVGAGEAQSVKELLESQLNCRHAGVIADLNGIERIVWART
ncbi:MAG: peptide chain release factor N(5)-glutamine methyltransferase [Clostridia bacterium]|nr:peptide chain release factor N(5)-glutamine methyltransferase [Clostridia bacterium]